MKVEPRSLESQLAVVGTGLAGIAAAIFARDRGMEVAQVGGTGALAYTTGYLDLLGVDGAEALADPWAGLAALAATQPDHPLARLEPETVRGAFTAFTRALGALGIGYTAPGGRNLRALLPAGLTKPTLSVPDTMAPGIAALAENTPTVVVGIDGLAGFSAAEFVANMAPRWPRLVGQTVAFPEMEGGGPVFAEVMARALEVPANRAAFAERLEVVRGAATHLGLPAILGVHRPDAVRAEMERLVGARIFEIPTIPPAVPGIRLREMVEQTFPARGISLIAQQKVTRLEIGAESVTLHLADPYGPVVIHARAAILATGRFLSGGLRAGRDRIHETLLDLPVHQPADRQDWYRIEYLDPRGHAVNQAGVEVDGDFRPLGADGKPVSPRLFAVGALLAHQDWVRQRCGAGLAIASAHAAVAAAAAL